jgi:hypothetical protein
MLSCAVKEFIDDPRRDLGLVNKLVVLLATLTNHVIEMSRSFSHGSSCL